MKKLLVGLASAAAGFVLLASPAFANPPTTSPANPIAQCGTGAASGAFNFQNSVYGDGTTGINGNSRSFGQAGGSGGGQTGINNSSVCGNRPN